MLYHIDVGQSSGCGKVILLYNDFHHSLMLKIYLLEQYEDNRDWTREGFWRAEFSVCFRNIKNKEIQKKMDHSPKSHEVQILTQ